MTEPIWDDLFHAAAVVRSIEQAREQQGSTRQRAYQLYEDEKRKRVTIS